MAARCITRSCSQFQLVASNKPCAARAFLQLSPPPLHNQASTPISLLDFLVPRFSRSSTGTFRTVPASVQKTRPFTSSAIRQQTAAVVNPKKDEDGNEMNIEITRRASNVYVLLLCLVYLLMWSQRLKEIMSKDSNPNLALRIQVESGGCHGFQYLMSLTTLPTLNSILDATKETPPQSATLSSVSVSPITGVEAKVGKLEEDDTVFAAEDGSGAKVVMDGPSLELLKGSKVDFTMELIGSQFKIVDNPLATSSCGCGTSFAIKV